MAHKRAFSKTVVETDAFQDMPQSAQLLYFYLNIQADDDGFVGNPKRIMRGIGVGDDDLKILLSKRFLIAFESGVVVIKHWLIHNTIRKDRYTETSYLREKKMLQIKENKAYTEDWQPNGNQLATQDKIREDKIREDNITANADYKALSNRIDYEAERTFGDKKPAMSFLMGLVKKYGEGQVLAKIGAIREGGTVIKEPTSYLMGVFMAQEKQGLVKKITIK